ncbi:hypothetical protein HOLleu_37026 [Holothuria leucospilota]|uniref:Uncharacterized protein n=1 Tax=Holothuria leucospilota TaxID=206669 RepID=A0A9Q0YPF9_HOLLE|nr:hypothetical protein HOLleu_37026 [Holothuria leucospilota]
MKMNISATTVIQLGILMALFCLCMVSAEGRPNLLQDRRSQGWTPQALFLYGIMGPRRQKDVSYNTMKRTAWGPRPNIMRAWHPARVSRAVRSFDDLVDEDDEGKRAGWTGRSRVFGRAEDTDDKRVPEELLEAYEEFPLLKRMREIAEKRESEQNRVLGELQDFDE